MIAGIMTGTAIGIGGNIDEVLVGRAGEFSRPARLFLGWGRREVLKRLVLQLGAKDEKELRLADAGRV